MSLGVFSMGRLFVSYGTLTERGVAYHLTRSQLRGEPTSIHPSSMLLVSILPPTSPPDVSPFLQILPLPISRVRRPPLEVLGRCHHRSLHRRRISAPAGLLMLRPKLRLIGVDVQVLLLFWLLDEVEGLVHNHRLTLILHLLVKAEWSIELMDPLLMHLPTGARGEAVMMVL